MPPDPGAPGPVAGDQAAPTAGAPPSRLLWRCRRGTREMDLLLMGWLERHWATASAEERAGFEALLQEQDPDILDWVLGRQSPPSAHAALIRTLAGLLSTPNPPAPGTVG